jgi:molecular chaperone DnaK
MKKVIGIDLGTTNSVVSFKAKDVEILRNKENEELTRSCVGFKDGEPFLVGRPAFQLLGRDPSNTILSVKRLMGTAFKDEMVQKMILESKTIRGYYKFAITKLKSGTEDSVAVVLGGKQYAPEQISAEILKKLKQDAEERLGDEVTHAVITVPAYFTEKQKNATKLAAKYAGIKVLKLLAEPTAAAIAYGVDNLKTGEAKTVLIYDFGGGTFDLSILNIVDGQYLEMGTTGDRWLGGDDIDKELTNYIYKEVCSKYNLDFENIDILIENLPIKKKFRFLSDFRQKVEQLKIELSSSQKSDFILEDILEDENGDSIDINITIFRKDFERIVRPYIQKSINLIDELLKNMCYEIDMIDSILLVGGTSCIPLVKEMLVQKYGNDKIRISKKPMLSIAEGAAILAHRLDDDYEVQPDITEGVIQEIAYSTNHNLYIRVKNAEGQWETDRIVEKQMPLPFNSTKTYKTSINNQKIVKLEIVSDAEEGKIENNSSFSFVVFDVDLPANSQIVFEFLLGIDETMDIVVYPFGQKNKAKKVPLTRGQKDTKAFQVIDEEIRDFNSGKYNFNKVKKFEEIIIEKLKDAEEIGFENPLDDRWSKISYETLDFADRIKSESNENGEMDYSILAKILVANYHDLIPDDDLQKMRKYIQIIEDENDSLKVLQAQEKLESIINEYPVLFEVFFIKFAAQQATNSNISDSQNLNKMHDQIVYLFKNGKSEEAFELIQKALRLAETYINIKDMGKIITDIKK